jgi:monoterpene epsilon-lactone hydrolase
MAQSPDAPSGPGIEVVAMTLGGVSCVVCQPARPIATLVYFHGGGYRLGSARWSTGFGSRLAAAANARLVLVDYGLAPEDPFPAALHDATAVLDASRSHWPFPIVAGGDSAGGGLATALTVAARQAGVAPPDGLVLLSPWLDLTVSAGSYESRATADLLFSRAQAKEAALLYLQGWDPRDPLVSPIFADLAGFPPVLLFASAAEVLLDDSLTFVERLAHADTRVEVHVVVGAPHVWPTTSPELPESAAALRSIAVFLASLGGGRG